MLKNTELPDNITELKELIINLQNSHEKQLKEKDNKYLLLEEQFKTLQKRFFSRKSEKTREENPDQPDLFNEAEIYGNLDPKQSAQMDEEIPVKSYSRKKKRKPRFPAHLPVKKEIHDLSPEEKNCACCGKERPCIGEEETKELDIVPEQVRIIEHVLKKYGPCNCHAAKEAEAPAIITAKRPPRLLPGIMASVGLLSYIFVSKFLDSMPFHRQENRFKRFGMEISRTNMCNWLIACSRKCGDLLDLMWKIIRAGPFIQMDETGMQVLKEPGRSPEQKGYMFVTIGYDEANRPLVVYHYHRTRNMEIVADILKGFKGYLQTDGLKIYKDVEKTNKILKVGCGAHMRRYFVEAASLCSQDDSSAHQALKYFRKIYRIEKRLRQKLEDKAINRNDFVQKRSEETEPVLQEFHAFLVEAKKEVVPQAKLGVAINYALNQWGYWIRYLDEWFLTPDNNYPERKVRDYVIGRKNWTFADTLKGAYASCTMFSLIHTAKENGLDPYWYLRYLFTELPKAKTEDDLRRLLPMSLDNNVIKGI